jgi:hypothetical protein
MKRQTVISIVVVLLVAACADHARHEDGPTVKVDQSTPQAAMRSMQDALAAGDEAGYRKVLFIEQSGGYRDVQTSVWFAAIRLHQAVEERLGIRSTPRATTQDRAERLMVTDFRPQGREGRKQLEALKITIEGDTASFEQARDRGPVMRRIDGRWRYLGPADEAAELPTDPVYAKRLMEYERGMLAAIEEARRAVLEGDAKTIADVNRILRRRIPKPEAD